MKACIKKGIRHTPNTAFEGRRMPVLNRETGEVKSVMIERATGKEFVGVLAEKFGARQLRFRRDSGTQLAGPFQLLLSESSKPPCSSLEFFKPF